MKQQRLVFLCLDCRHEFFDLVVEKCPRCDGKRIGFCRSPAAAREMAAKTLRLAPGEKAPRERFLEIKARQRVEAAERIARERGRE